MVIPVSKLIPLLTFLCGVVLLVPLSRAQDRSVEEYKGLSKIKFLNYEDCIEIQNDSTRIVLGHHIGGRILSYEVDDKNVLYLSPQESEWDPNNRGDKPPTSAGRFDLGPEYIQARGQQIWSGPWTASVIGDRKARMTSEKDPKSGLIVHRDFALHPDSSRLTIKQTVENHSDGIVRQGYWSRTFAKHGGVAIIPCDPLRSRMPNWYCIIQKRFLVDFEPEDPAVRQVGEFVVVDGPTKFPKLGFDAVKGWVAYQTRDNQLFVKRYQVSAIGAYGEATGINLSIYYPNKERLNVCEIEPIGPMEIMEPGDEASFTVDWWLLERKFPESGVVDPEAVAKFVEEHCVMDGGEK